MRGTQPNELLMRHCSSGVFVDQRARGEAVERKGEGERVRLLVRDRVGEDPAGAGGRLEPAGAPAAVQINPVDRQPPDDRRGVGRFCPIVNIAGDSRYPVLGGTLQRRGGVARHDAVAWGYARAADARGVDIIENCEVTAIRTAGGRVVGVDTSRGAIDADKVAISAAGHNSLVAAMAGVRLPLQSHPLQALVSEPVKPVLDCVVMSGAVHVYVSQSDKGELVMGAGIDAYNSYAQRGSFHVIEGQMAALLELFPIFSRLKMLRSWAGIVDVAPDASPIIGRLPIEGLYLNGSWGTGGFKATPGAGWVFAHTIAHEEPHPLALPFALDRFTTGALIDEHAAAAVSH